MTLEEKIAQVESLFVEIDRDLSAFQAKSGLSCTAGCSACCRKPDIEATVLEFLPLAFFLYKENKADEFYELLTQDPVSPVCVLYHPVQNITSKGGCSIYSQRGFICRVFGFSFTRDKNGLPKLATCREIKTKNASAYEAVNEMAATDPSLPMMSNYHARLTEIDPYHSQKLYPINEAIRRSLEIVGNHFFYKESFGDDLRSVS
jgi:Fe-S-cluster containining protein